MPERKTTNEQIHAIEAIHRRQAEQMQEAWTLRHRFPVGFDIAFVDETTFAEFLESIQKPCASYAFGIEPFAGPALFDYSRSVIEGVTTEQLKGRDDLCLKPGQAMDETHRQIMGPVITRDLVALEKTWEPVMKIRVSDAELESDPAQIGIAAPGDTIVLVALEAKSERISGLVNIVYPLFALEPVLPKLVSASTA